MDIFIIMRSEINEYKAVEKAAEKFVKNMSLNGQKCLKKTNF